MPKKCKHEKALETLTVQVYDAIRVIDSVMKQTESHKRGEAIGRIVTYLAFAADSAAHFTLDWGWKKIANRKKGPRK